VGSRHFGEEKNIVPYQDSSPGPLACSQSPYGLRSSGSRVSTLSGQNSDGLEKMVVRNCTLLRSLEVCIYSVEIEGVK